MPSGIRLTACLISSLVLTGCAANDLTIKRQAEAEAKIEHLILADKRSVQRQNDLNSQLLSLQDQVKSSATQIKQLQTSIQELRSSQDELKARLALQAQQNATPKIEVVNADTTQQNRDSSPPAEYVKAFGLYSANNFSAAIETFQAFLTKSPHNEYAANAAYWIGECHFSLSEFPQALAAFQKAVDGYPKSAKAADALLKLGYTQAALKEPNKATATFERLIKTYPSSPAAAKARERLTAQ